MKAELHASFLDDKTQIVITLELDEAKRLREQLRAMPTNAGGDEIAIFIDLLRVATR